MYKAFVCTLCCLFAGTMALVGKTCTINSQCDPSECCQILNAFMIASKRLIETISWSARKQPTHGTCQKYKLEGDNCSSFEKINGYCSCEPGTVCHTYEVPWGNTVRTRLIAAPRFGYDWVSKCEKTST